MIRIFLGAMVLVLISLGPGLCQGTRDVEDLFSAARSGDTRAMCDLGVAYYHGKGVLKDPFKAKCWVKQAHDLGDEQAEKIWNRFELWQYSGVCPPEFEDHPRPAQLSGDRYQEPVTGMAFVWLQGKCFKMGCEKEDRDCGRGESSERVCLDGFWMGQYEVDQRTWLRLMNANPSRFHGDDLPVEQVSFREIQDFISRLNRATGLRFALPTEAQWEFACRNRGRRSTYPWGRESFQPQANCGGCNAGAFRGRTAPTGSFLPNEAGIYDMGGNVREWCRDVYEKNRHQRGKKRDDKNANSPRVIRGGSFVDPVSSSRCRARESALPGMKTYYTGFRLVLKEIQ